VDTDRSGTIDKREFTKAMSVLRIDLSRSDTELLYERYDTDRNGLDYKEFMELIGFGQRQGSAVTRENRISDQVREDTDNIIKSIRRKLEDYLGPGANSARKIKEIFAEVDTDRSGTIDKREFTKAMSVLRIDLSRSDTELLYERYDTDRNGLDYKEFMELIGFGQQSEQRDMRSPRLSPRGRPTLQRQPSINDQLQEDTDNIIKNIRRKLEDYLGPGAGSAKKIKEVFAEMDDDRSGTIDKREFEKAMTVLRVNLTRSDTELLFERYDRDRSGLNYRDFMDLIGFSSASPRKSVRGF